MCLPRVDKVGVVVKNDTLSQYDRDITVSTNRYDLDQNTELPMLICIINWNNNTCYSKDSTDILTEWACSQ